MKSRPAPSASATRFRRKPLITALEPRLLLDGAAVATTVDMATDVDYQDQTADQTVHSASAEDSVHFTEAAAPTASEPSRREVAFIDTQVQDYQALVDGMAEGVEVFLIEAGSSGLEQMLTHLQGQSGIDAIHVYSHGAIGQLTVGSLTLNGDNLAQYGSLLTQLGETLTENGDLMLYGCYVGSYDEGQAFIDEIGRLSGADVAASSDRTGSSSVGGDWELERTNGSVETDALVVPGFEGVLAAPVISNLASSITFLEGSGAITIDSDIVIGSGGTYTEGFVRFSITSPNSGDQLTLSSSATPTADGAISLVGSDVYLGNGTTRDRIGSIDATENGQNGAALKILFSSPLPNAGFEEGEANWTIVDAQYGDGGDEINFDGYQVPLANNSDGNSTYVGGTGTVNVQLSNGAQFNGSVASGAGIDGSKALYLSSSGSIVSGDQLSPGSFSADGYGSIHGPYARSSVISVENGDSLSLEFKAVGSGDDYEVFGLLRKVNGSGVFLSKSLSDGNNIVLFAERGADTGGYKTVTYSGLTAGEYRFEFVGGTYDGSGGLVVGSNLYVDNIRLISGTSVTDSVASTIARQVQYQNTATDSPESRTLTISARNQSGETGSSTTTLNIDQANNAPSFNGNGTLNAVNEDTTPAGSSVSSLFNDLFSDPDTTYTPADTLAGIAIVGDVSTSTQGTWEYSTNSGTNWYAIGSVSTSDALLLSSSTLIRFRPSADWNGTPGSLAVHAVDSSHAGGFTAGSSRITFDTTSDGPTSAVSAAAVSLTTSVTPVNDAPTLTGLPSDITVTEDLASSVDLSGVTLADIDSTGPSFTLTLTVGAGALTAGSTAGVTVSGSGTGSLTLTGTVASINAYLNAPDGIKYTGAANANGNDATTLTLTANDQNGSGNVVLGVANIDITAVNDLPTIKGLAGATVNEDTTLSITGFTIDDIDGDSVRIRVLAHHGSVSLATTAGVAVHSSGGTLEFSGSVADAGAALNSICYTPNANFNGTDDLSLEISDDAGVTWQIYTVDQPGKFYYPFNGHYYEFVSAPGITWTAAKAAAEVRTLYGLSGYLVTVSSVEEQAFIAPKLGGEGWMGASDDGTEGTWIWAVGPEAGTQFWQDESGELGTTEYFQGYPVNGMYHNWADGEPNNWGGNEDYAHFLSNGFWNDYGNSTYVAGYVVEYGGTGFGTLEAAPFTITVNGINDAPVFTSSPVTISLADTPATDSFSTQSGALLANDLHDGAPNEGGTLTFAVSGGSDSGTDSSRTGTYGVLTVNKSNGAYTFVPNEDAINRLPAGSVITESFTITVSDGQGGTTSQVFAVQVTPANDTPVGVPDANSVIEAGGIGNALTGAVAIGNVLANDTDVDDGDTPLLNGAVTLVREATAGVNASVTANTTSSDGLVVTGLYGTLRIGADGSYHYEADDNNPEVQALRTTGQTLNDRFTYALADTGGLTAEAILTITIDGRNDNPVAVDDAATAIEAGGFANGTAGTNASGNVLANDTDPDAVANGETKTVTAVRTGAESGAGTSGTVGAALIGSYGILTLNANGSFTYVIDESNASVQALRVSGQTVSESFTYTVTDAGGLTDQATLTITIDGRNDNPVAVDDAATAIEAGGVGNATTGANATGNVLTNDTDVDTVANGETKTVTAVRTGAEAVTGTSGTVGQSLTGTYGALTLNADGSYTYVIDESNAAVQALRVSGQTVSESFTYTVTDAGGLTDQATLTITIDGRNDAPVADNVGIDQTWPFGKGYSFDISTRFSDVDSAGNGENLDFTLTGLPDGLSYDAETGIISGIPTGIGKFTVTMIATDRSGASASRQFVLEILAPPQPPVVAPVAEAPPPPSTPTLDTAAVTNDTTPLPTGTVNTGLQADPVQEVGFMAPSQPIIDPAQAGDDPGTAGSAGPGNVSAPDDGASAGNSGTERILVAEGNTRVSEVVSPDGRVTSVRASIQVEVATNGQVVFNDVQKQAFGIVGLSVSSISSGDNGLSVSIADAARGQDTQFYTGELGNGESLPDWITVDQTTGEITIGNPPPGIDAVTVRVKAIGSDGKVRMLDIELKLSDLLKRKSLQDLQPDSTETLEPVGFVPLTDQVAAEVASSDGYGERLIALLEAA